MVLRIVVLLSIAVYCAYRGEWGLAGLAAAAILPKIGLFLAMALAVILAIKGWYWPAGIIAGLIVFNLVLNALLDRAARARGYASFLGE